MTDLNWWSSVLAFGVAALVTLVCTPVALRAAKRWHCFDIPAGGKSHEAPVPYLGGSAMVISFVLVAVVAGLVETSDRNDVPGLAVFLAMAVGLAVLGLVDDFRGLSPWPRLALEIGAGIGVWATTNTAWLPGPPLFQAVATVCWVVIVTNSFNLLDNMDGLAAGIAAVSSIFLFALAVENGQYLLGTFALGLAGCSIGFLRYNFQPARIYMGDSGSLFLGFVLAVLSLDIRFPTSTPVTFVVPLLIVGVALFDTTLVSITRLLHGRTPFEGGLTTSVTVWSSSDCRPRCGLPAVFSCHRAGIDRLGDHEGLLDHGPGADRPCDVVRPRKRHSVGSSARVPAGWQCQNTSSGCPDSIPSGSEVRQGSHLAIGRGVMGTVIGAAP